ncbi:HAMP domain-containing histidine kinase [Stieleria sp. JC731]|uniref:sensor histidine kinase n=1 Tax=Pirellulaceae TaxID=2691357 RepID=UPI001E3BC7F4|nr:HAMP domain-containing sensor histidine kinase [Stieleria sp. JC731]MCC9599665.1 HAMP domain-containing histidine kinase [Stieleria sp. JC731]
MSAQTPTEEPMVPQSTRSLGWWGVLPPIVNQVAEHSDNSPNAQSHGNDQLQATRAWLPLSDTATVAISLALTSKSTSHDTSALIGRLKLALAKDPPLLIFALLSAPTGLLVSLTDLAHWFLSADFASRFADGEWALSAPTITDNDQQRWSRLMSRSRSKDPQTWVEDANEWLRVKALGPDQDYQDQIPRLIWDVDEPANHPALPSGSQLLHALALDSQERRAVDHRFDQTIQEHKFSMAKQLAYGLSHEINNPLANISARAQALASDEADDRRRHSLEQIVRQVFRAHEMISGLMFYANPTEPVLQPFDLVHVVREASAEYEAMAEGQGIRLLSKVPEEEVTAIGDRSMILEAIRVLLRNAFEAVGRSGTIVVSLRSDGTDQYQYASPTNWVIDIADSGPGLSAEASKHAFDPYFSGREAGRGLGLGLCRAYRIAELHGATISLTGGLAGCVATITLPNNPE